MLTLDLIRHGEATPPGSLGDRQRTLAPRGREVVARLAARLHRDGWKPLRLFASPYPRALETAGMLAAAAGAPLRVEDLDALLPDADPAGVAAALAARGAGQGHVALVSHMPLLGLVVAELAGLDQGFAPGALVRLEFPEGLGGATARLALSLDPPDYA